MSKNIVEFTVIKHLPIGLKVKLEDGQVGTIRKREISWNSEDRKNWRELCPEGWESKAVILEPSEENRLELSLRLAQNDPWEEVPGRFTRGQIVKGIVKGIENYGAFVEISTGVTGLLHNSRLPSGINKNCLDLFWPGDHVLVKINNVDIQSRRIDLALASRTFIFPEKHDPKKNGNGNNLLSNENGNFQSNTTLEKLIQPGNIQKHIVLIEDDNHQASAISSWLEKIGQRVDSCFNGEDGLNLIEKDPPDFALIDLGLPDISGIDVVRKIQENWPDVQCVITTDWARADEYVEELEDLEKNGAGFLLKPILPDDLLDMLIDINIEDKSEGNLLEEDHPTVLRNGFSIGDFEQNSLNQAVKVILNNCLKRVGFQTAMLFEMDTAKRTISILGKAGKNLHDPGALNSLIYSPIRDIAEDGKLEVIEELDEQFEKRYKYLLEFYPVTACIGIPVSSNSPLKYAIVLLDSFAKSISNDEILYVEAYALVIGMLIDQQTFQQKSIFIQRTALLGHLTRGLVHEINHQVGRLYMQLNSLKSTLEDVEKNGVSEENNVRQSLTHLQNIDNAISSLTKTTRQFGRIITNPKKEFLRLDELVQSAIQLLREQSDRARVEMRVVLPESMVIIRSQGTSVEQVLINILLNAIQQIEECPFCDDGVVQINFEAAETSEGVAVYRIIVKDDGPGIHKGLWDQVFDIGFTTRKEGSGMGLYISRSLMEALGGRLYIEESFILGGSSFVVELPRDI